MGQFFTTGKSRTLLAHPKDSAAYLGNMGQGLKPDPYARDEFAE
jgi:hypothetical protein